jgi:hypothetical protein
MNKSHCDLKVENLIQLFILHLKCKVVRGQGLGDGIKRAPPWK